MAMSSSGRFGDYLPVAARIAKGRQQAQQIATRGGRNLAPVASTGRDVAGSFWGQAWCRHLERYSDIANRLSRGRTLLRNGSVVDLVITKGRVEALVCGSTLYHITVTIVPAEPAQWRKLVATCGGRIDSVVELLSGRISDAVMKVLTDPGQGLLPQPQLISFVCSCPDAARLCKHIAATLYGIGARLDAMPELLFVLRDVDPNDLVHAAVNAGAGALASPNPSLRLLAPEVVSELFGVQWDPSVPSKPRRSRKVKP